MKAVEDRVRSESCIIQSTCKMHLLLHMQGASNTTSLFPIVGVPESDFTIPCCRNNKMLSRLVLHHNHRIHLWPWVGITFDCEITHSESTPEAIVNKAMRS